MNNGPNPTRLFPLGHFYSPVIDPAEVRENAGRIWADGREMPGINYNLEGQLALLEKLAPFVPHIQFPVEQPKGEITYFYKNDQYPALDAEAHFAMLCHLSPKRVIEVGCGFSSLVTAEVNRRFFDNRIHFTCIEPYPRQFLIDGVPGISELVVSKVQDVELSFFEQLDRNDILFIDSSHVTKTGNDLNFLLLEVIPRLRKGVIVHFHDIFLPDDYPQVWVIDEERNWNEQYLVSAFLQFNNAFEVMWGTVFLGKYHQSAVEKVFPGYLSRGCGGSLWIRRLG
jgi:hypothetical protein